MDTQALASATTAASGRKKRRLLPIVDARFQWKYTAMMTVLGAGTAAIMGGLLYSAQRDTSRLLELAADRTLQEQVARGDQRLLMYLVLLVVLLAVMLAAWGLIVTHRISGPVYLAARDLNVLAQGGYPNLRPLRKHDELQHFFAALTGAVQALRSRDRERLRLVTAALDQARKGGATADELRGALKATTETLETLRSGLLQSIEAGEPRPPDPAEQRRPI
jgi:hypothetical protein